MDVAVEAEDAVVEAEDEVVEAKDEVVEAEDEVVEAEDVDVVDVVEVDELLVDAKVVVEDDQGNLTRMKLHGGSVDSGWVHKV